MWFFLVFLLPLLAAAETGGLQELPFPPGTDIERSVNVIANGNFQSPAGWSSGSWIHDATTTRTPDGSGALRITDRGSTEAQASQNIASETLNQYRIFRLRAWLRASAPPGDSAQFRVYFFQRGAARFCGKQFNIASLSTQWKEYTAEVRDCEYLHTFPPHLDQDIQIRLLARNIPSGVNVWVDDVSLTPILRPLVIFPTYPNYRGMLWPDQGTTIKWNAVVEPPDGETLSELKVRVQVVRASDSQVLDTVQTSALAPPVSSLATVWYRYSVTPMQYDASGLPEGAYYLRGTLRRAAGDVQLYQYPDYKIVKEDPSLQRENWKVWVDRYNRTVLDGKPQFLWGVYAGFTFGRNSFPSAAGVATSDPDRYRAIAGGCDASGTCSETTHKPVTRWDQQFGLGRSTIMRQWADVGHNTVVAYANFGTYNVGLSTPVPGLGHSGTGTLSSSGTTVTGAGTDFGAEILGPMSSADYGDVIRVNGITGTGTITYDGNRFVSGNGTAFQSQLRAGDWITVSGSAHSVLEVISDTSMRIQFFSAPSFSGASFTIDQFRRVVSVTNATTLEVDAAFRPDLSGSSYNYERCATGGVRYQGSDFVSPFITALQDHGMWYQHIVGTISSAESHYHRFSNWAPRCLLLTHYDHTKWLTRFKPLGTTAGFMGYYLSDEPSYNQSLIGVEAVFEKQKGHAEANMGGMSFWVDGWLPMFSWDQWNNFADSWHPDPYPSHGSGGANPDDFGYGLRAWQKHGRSWGWPRRSAASGFDRRPVHTAIQAFGWTTLLSSYPSLSDHKIQLGSALAAGTQGIFWWAAASSTGGGISGAGADRYESYRKAAKWIQSFLPILHEPLQDLTDREDGEPDYDRIIASVSDPAIKCSTRRRDDQRLIACANTTNEDKTVTITTVDPIPGKVRVPWDDSTITPATGTTFQYTFKGLNGGTQRTGPGTITASGTKITCSGCDFRALFGTVNRYDNPTITSASGTFRMVLSVDGPTEITVDQSSTMSNTTWTYSPDSDKYPAAEVFIIEPPAGSKTQSAGN